jgi:hypothetical protein
MRRVPPFLQTIQDPRAAQGGSLKGCPVCGGKVVLVLLIRDIHAPFRSRSRHLKLSQAGGRATPTDGVAEGRTRRRGWLLASVTFRHWFPFHFDIYAKVQHALR